VLVSFDSVLVDYSDIIRIEILDTSWGALEASEDRAALSIIDELFLKWSIICNPY